MSPPELPLYSEAWFVDREDEVALVENAIQQMLTASGAQDQPRTIVFRGERGLGKSWLALYLERKVLPKTANGVVTPLLISLAPHPAALPAEEGEWVIDTGAIPGDEPARAAYFESLTTTIVIWVAMALGITRTQHASLRDLSRWLSEDVQKSFSNRILALVVDAVFEADWTLLKLLETHLLAPLATLPRVLIILIGRGRDYPWVSPYLRVEKREQILDAFDRPRTVEQLNRQIRNSEDLVDQVIELGGGYPLTNYLLAHALASGEPDQARALDAVAEQLLEVVPSAERRRLRSYFEALCLLDGCLDNEISHMLTARSEPHKEYSIAEARGIREQLVATHLMHWENKRYVIDSALQKVLAGYLKLSNPQLWRRLHEQAYQLYTGWANQFPDSAAYFKKRAERHAAPEMAVVE